MNFAKGSLLPLAGPSVADICYFLMLSLGYTPVQGINLDHIHVMLGGALRSLRAELVKIDVKLTNG